MKHKTAAVLATSAAQRRELVVKVKEAGLQISRATRASELQNEDLVILGARFAGARATVQEIRRRLPDAIVLVASRSLAGRGAADAVLPLPVSARDLRARLPELGALRRGTALPEAPSPWDPLTGFYTFGYFKEVLFVELKRARRYGIPLAAGLVAFDPMGRKLAASVRERLHGGLALAVRRSLRDTDYPVQFAPDRVLVFMPHTDLAGAVTVCRRICERVSKSVLTFEDQVLHPSVSIGVAGGAAGGQNVSVGDLMRRLQVALGRAIEAGGNRVEFFDRADEEEAVPAPG